MGVVRVLVLNARRGNHGMEVGWIRDEVTDHSCHSIVLFQKDRITIKMVESGNCSGESSVSTSPSRVFAGSVRERGSNMCSIG